METELEDNTATKQNEGGGGEGAVLVGRCVGERGSAEVKLGKSVLV